MSSTTSQPHEALERANAVRMERARIKRLIGSGELDVADVIDERDPHLHTMLVLHLLLAQHRWGVHRAHRLLGRAHVLPHRAVGSLTPRERRALREQLHPELGPVTIEDPFDSIAFQRALHAKRRAA